MPLAQLRHQEIDLVVLQRPHELELTARLLDRRPGNDIFALAWHMVRRDEQFRSALASRDVIGQAKGLLMERFDTLRYWLKTAVRRGERAGQRLLSGLITAQTVLPRAVGVLPHAPHTAPTTARPDARAGDPSEASWSTAGAASAS